jgi:thioredoxin 1
VPVLDELAFEVAGRAVIAKLNASRAMELASRYGVTAIPTLILFKDGKETARLIGFQRGEKLLQLIDSVV